MKSATTQSNSRKYFRIKDRQELEDWLLEAYKKNFRLIMPPRIAALVELALEEYDAVIALVADSVPRKED